VNETILKIEGLTKVYPGNGGKQVRALDSVDLEIRKGEIFALLGPNGAGKTTLIGAVCGLVRPTSGTITAFGHDLSHHWREARSRIGLVPQELSTDMFETVERAVAYSRGLFGRSPDRARIEEVLRSLSLWDKRGNQIRELSGGMKRRLLIAKALAHEPDLLFLDEPTAGVDVELRKEMWEQVSALRTKGTTIILTTHYIEEAETMADRVGIIRGGRILMVDEKTEMMQRLGTTEAIITLAAPMRELPADIAIFPVSLSDDGGELTYRGGASTSEAGITGSEEVAALTKALIAHGIDYTRIEVADSSLEDIFVDLVQSEEAA